MHPLSGGYGGYGLESQQSPQEAGSPQQDPNGGAAAVGDNGQNGSAPNYSDINQILDQILNITDQSLDEAQVRFETFKNVAEKASVLIWLECTGSGLLTHAPGGAAGPYMAIFILFTF
jgi:hypothetical protein